MTNYIEGENPLRLAGPPTWWLQKLYDFDNSLYVVPSKQGHFYRLAQKRPLDIRTSTVHRADPSPDSQQLYRYGLIPVTTILSTAHWDNPLMWEDLRQRAPWRMGGADAYEKAILAKERQKNLDIAKQNDEQLTDRARDAWGYYLMKAGRRQNMWIPKTPLPADVKQRFGKTPLIKIVKS